MAATPFCDCGHVQQDHDYDWDDDVYTECLVLECECLGFSEEEP